MFLNFLVFYICCYNQHKLFSNLNATKTVLKMRKLVNATVLVIVTIALFASFLHPSLAALANATAAAVPNSGCWSKCKGRCSKTEVAGRCMKYCSICCQKCNCVPSGTVGNKHECPCYRDMVSSKGKPKCP